MYQSSSEIKHLHHNRSQFITQYSVCCPVCSYMQKPCKGETSTDCVHSQDIFSLNES